MAQEHGAQNKNDLSDPDLGAGVSTPQMAVAVTNAQPLRTIDHQGRLESRSRDALHHEAKVIGIGARSRMTRSALIRAIRSFRSAPRSAMG